MKEEEGTKETNGSTVLVGLQTFYRACPQIPVSRQACTLLAIICGFLQIATETSESVGVLFATISISYTQKTASLNKIHKQCVRNYYPNRHSAITILFYPSSPPTLLVSPETVEWINPCA